MKTKLKVLYDKYWDKWWDIKYLLSDQVDKVKYWWKTWIIGGITLILLLYIGLGWLALEKEVILVTDKGNKIVNSKTSSKERRDLYFIYTDTITYKMEDNMYYLQWDTSDDYGKLKKNKCYTIWSLGMRVGMLDWYENILYFEEIDCEGRR